MNKAGRSPGSGAGPLATCASAGSAAVREGRPSVSAGAPAAPRLDGDPAAPPPPATFRDDTDRVHGPYMRNARRRQLSGAHTAESWNAAHPVGTAVRYWPVYPPIDGIPPKDTTTRSEAWALGDGSVVVLVAGKAGGVCLTHVEVLP